MKLELPDFGDFGIGDLKIEVAGMGKGDSRVKNQMEYQVAADDIETGFGIKFQSGCSDFGIRV